MIYSLIIWTVEMEEMNKMLSHLWPKNKLSSDMAENNNVTGLCPTEFLGKLFLVNCWTESSIFPDSCNHLLLAAIIAL